MANTTKSGIDILGGAALPEVRKITLADLKSALEKGWDDFKEMPTFAIFLVVIYPVIGIVLFSLTFGYDLLPLIFPLMAGFALMGPLAAVGLYELSRRREQKLGISSNIFSFLSSPAIGSILILGAVLFAIFVAWIGAAQLIYRSIFDTAAPASIWTFAEQVLATSEGWTLIVVGCGVGFIFALTVFWISVISFPLLLDRNVGVTVAVLTSIKAVLVNPGAMTVWGLIIVAALVLGSLPVFIGLIIVLPVLGHATWHVYRAVVAH